MHVVVEHQIKDKQVAFARGERLMKNDGAPADVRVLQFYPSRDGSAVVCLWEAPSVDAVQRYVDVTLGDASDNTCWEVDREHAFARQPSDIAESPVLTA
jgi:hypothetical protein